MCNDKTKLKQRKKNEVKRVKAALANVNKKTRVKIGRALGPMAC